MKIGPGSDPRSAISAANADAIVVRGFDLCADLIGAVSLTDHFFLLVTGRKPTDGQRRVLDATLVAIAEHGLVPSVQASRMTYAAAPEALQGAVAAGILGCGSVILGASEAAGLFLVDVLAEAGPDDSALDAAARSVVGRMRAAKRPIPGYGHPLHKRQDPRVGRLLRVAEEAGMAGRHIRAAIAVEGVLPATIGKALAMNVSSAIPAVLLDAGFPVQALKGVPILARTASLVAHLVEEQLRPIGFILSEHAGKAIAYDGPAPAGFVPTT
ncbi:MAG: citryl-CoA lyase [Alphaproteobacteria bacterium]|nr:citryl-CoA lyase [Alphaproteobacteria bacterium]